MNYNSVHNCIFISKIKLKESKSLIKEEKIFIVINSALHRYSNTNINSANNLCEELLLPGVNNYTHPQIPWIHTKYVWARQAMTPSI